MTDVLTIMRKELRELTGERASRRGVQVQALILTLMLGVLLPSKTTAVWLANSPSAIVLFLLLPSVIAASIGADAFAGERERKTLETLLATPLSDRAIVAGKALSAVTAAMLVGLLAFVVATITVNVSASPASAYVPAPVMWGGALGGSLCCSCLSTAIAVFLSSKIAVARSVQQIVSLMFVVPIFVTGWIWGELGLTLDWPTLYACEGVGLAVGVLAIVGASLGFQRDKLFIKR